MTGQNENIKKLIVDYLRAARLMQVSTSSGLQPWACSVYFAFDDKLNLYWLSTPQRRHSREIRDNNNVAGTIVLPHTPGDSVSGVQFEGKAAELTDKKEIAHAMSFYAKRYGMDSARVQKIVDNSDGHMCYCIRPSRYVLFDEVHFQDEPRQEFVV